MKKNINLILYLIVVTVVTVQSFFSLSEAETKIETSAASLDCQNLTGHWQGTYSETTGLFGNSGEWPISFNLQYYPNNHIIYGQANTAFIPSAVSEGGKINYISEHPAEVIGYCEKGIISRVLLFNTTPKCGHYTKPGGKLLNSKILVLNLDYEFSMNEVKFKVFLHKTDNQAIFSNIKIPKLPVISSCH